MARVLFLTQVLPYPLNAGPKVRGYYMLRHLSKRHQVTLASFVRQDDTSQAVHHLAEVCHAVHTVPMRRSLWRNLKAGAKAVLTGSPAVIARDKIGEMDALLRQLTSQTVFDIVHADQLSMAGYGCQAAQHGVSHALLDEHNAIYVLMQRLVDNESGGFRRAIMAREARAFARYEAAMCQAYDAVLTVSREDRDALLALYKPEQQRALADKFTVVPISVDPDLTVPVVHVASGPPTILHVGTMFWPPNVAGVLWFAREVLPVIHQQAPARVL